MDTRREKERFAELLDQLNAVFVSPLFELQQSKTAQKPPRSPQDQFSQK